VEYFSRWSAKKRKGQQRQKIGGRIDGDDPGRHWTFGQVVDRIHDSGHKEEAQVGEPIRGGWIRCERFRLERSDERTVPE
jgi:hypothetical protein